jgi:hypothetical protein
MNDNKTVIPAEVDEPGLEDGGAIGVLPRFGPPEPELQATGQVISEPVAVAAQAQETPAQPQLLAKGEVATEPNDMPTTDPELPTEPQKPAATLTGVVLEHGQANFNFDKDESRSYFVKIRDDNGAEQIQWGLDLERAILEGNIEPGQRIELINIGKQDVQINQPIRNDKGEVIGSELKDVTRNAWEARLAPEHVNIVDSLAAPVPQAQANPQTVEDQVRELVTSILAHGSKAGPAPARVEPTPEEVARVAQHLNIAGAGHAQVVGEGGAVDATAGQRMQLKGGSALIEGVGALFGGAMNLAGTVGKTVGQAATNVANQFTNVAQAKPVENIAATEKSTEAHSGLPSVLPRLSEYRTAQVEKSAANFGQEVDAFWNSSTKLIAIKAEIERIANERGVSVQDINEKMKPGGEFAELREKFNASVSENPDSSARKKGMDKALDSYMRQYGRAQEELLNPEQQGNLHYGKLKQRLEVSQKEMEKKSSSVPAFANEKGRLEPSHYERLQEAITKIMGKLQEVAKEFITMIRGKTTDADAHAPSP